MTSTRLAFFLALGLPLAGCGDSGTGGTGGSGSALTLDGHTETALEKSLAKIRPTLSEDDADQLESIVNARRWKGQLHTLSGKTAAQVIAEANSEAEAERTKMSKYQHLQEQIRDLKDLNLPEAEHKKRHQDLLRQIKALGIHIPDSALEN